MPRDRVSQWVGSQCNECSAVELSSFVNSVGSLQVIRSSWKQRISSWKIRKKITRLWGQAEQLSETLREASLSQSGCRAVWARTAELSQLTRAQKAVERMSFFSNKTSKWQNWRIKLTLIIYTHIHNKERVSRIARTFFK